MGLCLLPRYEISKDFGAIVKKKKKKISKSGRQRTLLNTGETKSRQNMF